MRRNHLIIALGAMGSLSLFASAAAEAAPRAHEEEPSEPPPAPPGEPEPPTNPPATPPEESPGEAPGEPEEPPAAPLEGEAAVLSDEAREGSAPAQAGADLDEFDLEIEEQRATLSAEVADVAAEVEHAEETSEGWYFARHEAQVAAAQLAAQDAAFGSPAVEDDLILGDAAPRRVAGKPAPLSNPRLALGLGFGGARYTGRFGEDRDLGPSWDARLALQLGPAFAVDGRFFTARHGDDGGRSTSALGVSFDARLSLPIEGFRPYVAAGVGWYTVRVLDDDGDVLVDPPLATQVPLTGGIELLLDDSFGLQFEVTHRLLFERKLPDTDLSATRLWTGTVGARLYF